MKFNLLLFGIFQMLRVASLTNRAFKFHIKSAGVRILFKTEDNSVGRLIIFDKGKIRSLAGAGHAFDLALVFKNADAGFATLSSRKPDATFKAAARGDMHLEGMSAWAVWFEAATKLIM